MDIPIIAQAYDGASIQQFPFAVYVHCMAHKINPVLAEACTVNRNIKTSLNGIDKLNH